jgi:hypothetical protein
MLYTIVMNYYLFMGSFMMIYCCYSIDHDAFMSVFCFIDTSLSKHVAMIIDFGFRLRTSEV